MIAILLDLARGGKALELGIGTGRIALPLYHAGIKVYGIDASHAMIEKLKTKPEGENIPVFFGDFADFDLDERFNLIFVVFNTFFGLQTQEDQLQCFRNVANHLSPKGVFLIEAFFPDMTRYIDNQTVRMVDIGDDDLRFEVTQIDPLTQRINSKMVLITDKGTRIYPIQIRYAWPAELDLMAKHAGLELLHRWGTWSKTQLKINHSQQISVYRFAG